jgi:hypothetical protein
MVEPVCLALTTTPSIAPSRSEETRPLNAVSADCANAGASATSSQAEMPARRVGKRSIDFHMSTSWLR